MWLHSNKPQGGGGEGGAKGGWKDRCLHRRGCFFMKQEQYQCWDQYFQYLYQCTHPHLLELHCIAVFFAIWFGFQSKKLSQCCFVPNVQNWKQFGQNILASAWLAAYKLEFFLGLFPAPLNWRMGPGCRLRPCTKRWFRVPGLLGASRWCAWGCCRLTGRLQRSCEQQQWDPQARDWEEQPARCEPKQCSITRLLCKPQIVHNKHHVQTKGRL